MVIALVMRGVQHEWGSSGWGGAPRTLEEELGTCPRTIMWFVESKLHPMVAAYQLAAKATSKHAGDVAFHPSWADDYVTTFWVSAIKGLVGLYAPRYADSVPVPFTSADPPCYRIGSVLASDRDIDSPYYFPVEKFIPHIIWDTVFVPVFTCYMQFLRDMPLADDLDGTINTWNDLLVEGKYPRKEDWVMSFYDGRYQWDGKTPAYPALENHFSKMFFKADQWDDGLEKALAFDLIGVHKVQRAAKEIGGETLPYVIPTNEFAAVEVRPHFGRYGADMYFTAEGMPAAIVTPEARVVKRGDKDWQYWKFVWRSTLASTITFVDHLHVTHFRAANLLARASRKTLPPKHMFRRFMSIFTFGTVFVNNMAMHTLLGTGHSLHRSTPFAHYEALVESTPSNLASLVDLHQPFLNDTAWEELPDIMKQAPYFADGRLLFKALKRFIESLAAPMLKQGYYKKDKDYARYLRELEMEEKENEYVKMVESGFIAGSEKDVVRHFNVVLSLIWTVTGWHRHVGSVADIFRDPDLAAFSWRDGEPAPRPRQAMLMIIIAATTGTQHPKMLDDYTHLFTGIEREAAPTEAELKAAWASFQQELREVQREIHRRNELRRVKNYHADPSIVECSVAV